MSRRMIALAYALVLLAALLLRFLPAYYAAHLHPSPDAVEYAIGAVNLYERGEFVTIINHAAYPPRVTFGFPLLLLPALAIAGPVAYNGLYAVLFFSVAAVAMAMAVTREVFGHGAALVTGLVIAIGKQHIWSAQEVMSDSAAMCLALLAALLALRALRGRVSYPLLFLAGLIIGTDVTVRMGDVFVLGALLIFAVVLLIRSPRTAIRGALCLTAGAALPLAALLAYQWQTFGSPLQTAYQYWRPDDYENLANVFNLKYLLTLATDRGLPTIVYYGQVFAGKDIEFYRMRFAVMIVVGAVSLLGRLTQHERHGALLLGLLAAANLGPYLFYAFAGPRFVLLAAAVFAVLGGRGVVVLARFVVSSRRLGAIPPIVTRLSAALILLWLAGSVAVTGRAAIESSYLYLNRVSHAPWTFYPWNYELLRFADQRIPADALFISAQPAPLVDYYVLRGTQREYMAISRHKAVDYADKRPGLGWPVAIERADLLSEAIQQGRGVFLIDEPLIRRQSAWLAALRANFTLQAVASVSMPEAGDMTLYQLTLPKQ